MPRGARCGHCYNEGIFGNLLVRLVEIPNELEANIQKMVE